MDVLYLLIPLSVVLVFVIGAVLWFAVRSGQFENLDRPDFQLLADDDSIVESSQVRANVEGSEGAVRCQSIKGTAVV